MNRILHKQIYCVIYEQLNIEYKERFNESAPSLFQLDEQHHCNQIDITLISHKAMMKMAADNYKLMECKMDIVKPLFFSDMAMLQRLTHIHARYVEVFAYEQLRKMWDFDVAARK